MTSCEPDSLFRKLFPLPCKFKSAPHLTSTMAPPVTLPTRLIGDTPVSAMGFGAMGFSAFYIPKDKTDEGRLKVSVLLTIWE